MTIINHPSSGGNAMYTVDLLKGEGIPIPCRPGGIAMACLIVVLPLLLGLGLTSYYMDGRVIVSIERQQMSKLDAAANNLSAALKKKELLEQQKAQALGRLSDIKAAIDGYTQWSPALAAVVENLPDTLVLTRLEVRQDSVRRRVPAKDDPATKVDVSVPVRTLKLSVAGRQAATALDAVQNLQESLRSSSAIGPMLDTITVSQNTGVLDSQKAVLYELECVFKAGQIVQNN
jgi:Tfp pilus assembly protein PilN